MDNISSSPSFSFSYYNLDLVIKDNHVILPYNFSNDSSHSLTGFLPTTLFYHDNINLSIPIDNFILNKEEKDDKCYRLDVLFIGNNIGFNCCIGVSDYNQIVNSNSKSCSDNDNRLFSIDFTNYGRIRCDGEIMSMHPEFSWVNGDVISLFINSKEKEVVFMKNHKIIPYFVIKDYPNNLVVGVNSNRKGTFFHILFFGQVDQLDYTKLFKHSE